MSTKPEDSTVQVRNAQRQIVSRIGPAARFRATIDLSESGREIQIAGLRARNPGWSRADAVRHIIAVHLGADLPKHS